MTKPDFIIIGAMKSATSTLHSQLALQPDIFMTTPKEPNYFSDNSEYERGEDWYNSLFADAKANDLCGESSTHYTKLPDYPLTIERMAKRVESPKLIYVMRHPIDRLVSHYIHQWSQNIIKCDINQAIEQYDELIEYSCYAKQLAPYFKQFGSANVLPIFTEAIRNSPQKQLEKVASFIGYEKEVLWETDEVSQNISKDRIREFRGYDFLINSKLMTQLRRSLVPENLRNKVKNKLSMQKRPEIDNAHIEDLTILFDKDMAELADWLGVKLTCSTYRDSVINY